MKPQASSPWTTLISESMKLSNKSKKKKKKKKILLHLTPHPSQKMQKKPQVRLALRFSLPLKGPKKIKLFCVRRESNPGPIETVQEVGNLLEWQRWILPLNHKRFFA
jgi:hypothetical protein